MAQELVTIRRCYDGVKGLDGHWALVDVSLISFDDIPRLPESQPKTQIRMYQQPAMLDTASDEKGTQGGIGDYN